MTEPEPEPEQDTEYEGSHLGEMEGIQATKDLLVKVRDSIE